MTPAMITSLSRSHVAAHDGKRSPERPSRSRERGGVADLLMFQRMRTA